MRVTFIGLIDTEMSSALKSGFFFFFSFKLSSLHDFSPELLAVMGKENKVPQSRNRPGTPAKTGIQVYDS